MAVLHMLTGQRIPPPQVELSYQFTYSTSTTHAVTKSETVTFTLMTPPHHAAALYAKHYKLKVGWGWGRRVLLGSVGAVLLGEYCEGRHAAGGQGGSVADG